MRHANVITQSAEKRQSRAAYLLIFASVLLVAFVSSLKLSYSAQLVAVIASFNSGKSAASLALTLYYGIYAAAQLIIAKNIKKINMFAFMAVTSALSALSFGLIYFATSMWQIRLILAVNGVLQAGDWGGAVYFIGRYLPEKFTKSAMALLSASTMGGTLLAYGASAFFSAVATWRHTFLVLSILFFISLLLFLAAVRYADATLPVKEPHIRESVEKSQKGSEKPLAKRLVVLIFYMTFATFFVNLLYFALVNWLPSLLTEKHGMPPSVSMLLTILIPIGVFIGRLILQSICLKNFRFFRVCAWASVCTFLCALGLLFSYAHVALLAITLTVLAAAATSGAANLLGTLIPLSIRDMVDSGESALVVNAGASVGAALAPFLAGALMDVAGWSAYYIAVAVFAALVALLFFGGAVKQGNRKLLS